MDWLINFIGLVSFLIHLGVLCPSTICDLMSDVSPGSNGVLLWHISGLVCTVHIYTPVAAPG